MLEGPSLYLLKLVPRILIQTYYSSISYTLVRVSIYRNDVKRLRVGWISHPYNRASICEVQPLVATSQVTVCLEYRSYCSSICLDHLEFVVLA